MNPKLMHVGIQLGKTLVFLKRTAFERLEHLRSKVLGESAKKIQATVRRNIARAAFLSTLASIVISQSIARVALAKLIVARKKARNFVAIQMQKMHRGHLGRMIAFEARAARRIAAAASTIQSAARRKVRTNVEEVRRSENLITPAEKMTGYRCSSTRQTPPPHTLPHSRHRSPSHISWVPSRASSLFKRSHAATSSGSTLTP